MAGIDHEQVCISYLDSESLPAEIRPTSAASIVSIPLTPATSSPSAGPAHAPSLLCPQFGAAQIAPPVCANERRLPAAAPSGGQFSVSERGREGLSASRLPASVPLAQGLERAEELAGRLECGEQAAAAQRWRMTEELAKGLEGQEQAARRWRMTELMERYAFDCSCPGCCPLPSQRPGA